MAGADRLILAPGAVRRHTLALVCAGTASLAGHAWLLSSAASHGSPAAGQLGTGRPTALAARVLHVDRPQAANARPGVGAASTGPHAAPLPQGGPVTSSPDAPRLSAPSASAVEEGLDEYLPRRALTRAPVPDNSVFVPYPEGVPFGHWLVTLTLFIDAQGRVQHVRIADAALPPVLEASARQAFLQATYQPGEVGGQAVKSRIRIEVEFSAESLSVQRP